MTKRIIYFAIGSLQSFRKWLIAVFNPPYQLTLDDTIACASSERMLYVFKQYGSHEFIKLSYADILNSENILRVINPRSLIDIHLREYLTRVNEDRYVIMEQLRHNKFKIGNKFGEEVYSADFFCRNIDMFATMEAADICKIAYAAGFSKGRRASIEISEAVKTVRQNEEDAIVQGNIVKMTNYK